MRVGGALEHSANFARTSGSRESDFATIQHSSSNWRKRNLMQKAQQTLNEIHEMAKTKGRKFERVIASAGPANPVGELYSIEPTEVNPMIEIHEVKNMEHVRHSVHIPDSSKNGAALDLHDPITSVYRSRPSHHVEDSMISAASSSIHDTVMNSMP